MQTLIAIVFVVAWVGTFAVVVRGLTTWANGYFPNPGKSWDLLALFWGIPIGIVALGIVALVSLLPAFGVAGLLAWITKG